MPNISFQPNQKNSSYSSTSILSKKDKFDRQVVLAFLYSESYLTREKNRYYLTHKGAQIGGRYQLLENGDFYIVWPNTLSFKFLFQGSDYIDFETLDSYKQHKTEYLRIMQEYSPTCRITVLKETLTVIVTNMRKMEDRIRTMARNHALKTEICDYLGYRFSSFLHQ